MVVSGSAIVQQPIRLSMSGKRHQTVKSTEHQGLDVRLRCPTIPSYDFYLLYHFSYFVR